MCVCVCVCVCVELLLHVCFAFKIWNWLRVCLVSFISHYVLIIMSIYSYSHPPLPAHLYKFFNKLTGEWCIKVPQILPKNTSKILNSDIFLLWDRFLYKKSTFLSICMKKRNGFRYSWVWIISDVRVSTIIFRSDTSVTRSNRVFLYLVIFSASLK